MKNRSLSLPILDDAKAACDSPMTTSEQQLKPVPFLDFKGRAAVVTLGCAKNQVDSEVMLGVLQANGYEIVNQLDSADVAIVNTCGFLESAVKESIDAVLDAAQYKKTGRLRKLIVAGCAVERYGDEMMKALPEADSFITTDHLLAVADVAAGNVSSLLRESARPYFLYDDSMPRTLATPAHTAYVKVSEGCDRPCAFCIIPRIRGGFRSREPGSIVKEIGALYAAGTREFNLVAQDLTAYGKDLDQPHNLASLLRALDSQHESAWIRLFYAYPLGIDHELLSVIRDSQSVCEYLDFPLQHSSESVLRAMRRPLGKYSPRKITEFIKSSYPQIALRTTFIVGFPGETEQDVRDLENFICEGHFSSVGVFTFSPEQGTPAGEMDGQIPQKERDKRRERLMMAQKKVLQKKLSGLIGQQLPVLIDGPHEETELLIRARTRFQAPEVDGCVIINDVEDSAASGLQAGNFASVEITDVLGYDLIGKVLRVE
jgi:ribosomal protein S12 methylthiotransferase